MVKEILCEEVTSYQNDSVTHQSDTSYNTSTLCRDSVIYYFKRIFNSVNNSQSSLVLYKCSMSGDDGYKESLVKTKDDKTYTFHENKGSDKLERKQYNPTFSINCDPDVEDNCLSCENDEQFLNR